ncbi:MAG: DUF5686 family protein [Bacteroidia bacterium]|nr:DUF5686 family protein [Bacteroidia bacterium]
MNQVLRALSRLWLGLFILVLASSNLSAQKIFGNIINEEGKAISFVRIYVEDSRYGAISDANGFYELEVNEGNYRLIFQHLNYETVSRDLQVKEELELNIQMKASDLQMTAIEIQAGKRDPAYAIMKEVIANKKNNLKQFNSYTCQTYQKIKLETDTLPSKKERKQEADTLGISLEELPAYEMDWNVSKLIESQSTIYFKRPNSYKTVVNAFRDFKAKNSTALTVTVVNGDATYGDYDADIQDPYLFYTDVSDADINFYRNLVKIPDLGDRPFISPLNSTAWRLTYKYKLEETFFEEGRVNYRISVSPRNRDGPYFKGQLWIEDRTWAIKKVELDVLKSGMSFYEAFSIRHKYERTDDNRRILTEEEYLYEIKEGRGRFKGSSLAIHSEYELDVKIPKKVFKNELRRTEKEAFEKTADQWDKLRPFKLNSLENTFVKDQDSINQYFASAEYLQKADSGYNHVGILDILFNGVKHRNRLNGIDFYINPLVEQVQPLAVGGYRHRLGGNISKTFKRGYRIGTYAEIDYGFKNEDLKGRVNLNYMYNPRKFATAWIRYGNEYEMINDFETIQAIFSRGNYLNKVSYGVRHRMEVTHGWMLDVDLDFADYQAIDNIALSDWSQSLFGETNIPPTFDPFRQFLIEIDVKYTPHQKYQMEPYRKIILGSKWPTFRLKYKKAIPGVFGSEISYDFLELGLDHEFKPGTMGISRWVVRTGRFLSSNNVRFTDFKFFRGSDPILFFNPLQAFQSLGLTISTKNAYFRGNYVHDFNGVLLDKIPLLKRTPLMVSGGAGMLLIEDGSFFHSEVYGGLQWPFRIRRQRFKIGGYFVTSYSNQEGAIGSQWKVGISFYNAVRNRWEY